MYIHIYSYLSVLGRSLASLRFTVWLNIYSASGTEPLWYGMNSLGGTESD